MAAKILSAGIVILNWQQNHHKYLLLRAYNYWDFPKGMVEPGETPLDGAIREVQEETEITQLDFRWGHVYRETPPYNHGRKIARYYIAETPTLHIKLPINPILGRPEHSDYRWVTRTQAWRMLTPRVRAILEWADSVIGVKPSC
jgi:bis(5'-nucleosidyl)-tetraphosphatase